jgi:hypothetical protein
LSRRRVVSDLSKRLMIEGGDVDPAAAQVNFDNQLRASPRAAREWLRDGLRRDDLAQVVRWGRRSLILVAAQDRIVDVPRLERAVGGVPEVELAVIDQGGHAWTEAMIERQRQLLAAFLDDRRFHHRDDTRQAETQPQARLTTARSASARLAGRSAMRRIR